jgi:hypothetical protein
MDSKEAEKYIRLVKEQQQRGLQKLRVGEGVVGGLVTRWTPIVFVLGIMLCTRRWVLGGLLFLNVLGFYLIAVWRDWLMWI